MALLTGCATVRPGMPAAEVEQRLGRPLERRVPPNLHGGYVLLGRQLGADDAQRAECWYYVTKHPVAGAQPRSASQLMPDWTSSRGWGYSPSVRTELNLSALFYCSAFEVREVRIGDQFCTGERVYPALGGQWFYWFRRPPKLDDLVITY